MHTLTRFTRTLATLLVLLSIWTLPGCKLIRKWLGKESPPAELPRIPDRKDLHLPQQRILVLSDDTDPQRIASDLKVTVAAQCGCGDQRFVLITDPLLDGYDFRKSGPDGNYVGQLPTGKGGGSVNLDGLLDTGFNYRLEKDTTYGKLDRFSFNEPAGEYNKDEDALVIGVLDTGIAKDRLPERYRWKNKISTSDPQASCFNGDGRDFVANTDFPWDDDPQWHGSAVAALLLKQLQTAPYASRNVQIMPLKVLDKTGWGSVFHTMCALQYARHHQVKLLNLSLGTYAPIGEATLGPLRNLMRQMSTEGVTFLVAAGNPSTLADPLAQSAFGNVRDLTERGNNTFYPAIWSNRAAAAADNLNENGIIPVTTLSKSPGAIPPCQNFGRLHVRLGVTGEQGCSFDVPNYGGQLGSSFATPVATGRIARALFDLRTATTTPSRQQLIDHASQTDGTLQNFLVDGKRIDP